PPWGEGEIGDWIDWGAAAAASACGTPSPRRGGGRGVGFLRVPHPASRLTAPFRPSPADVVARAGPVDAVVDGAPPGLPLLGGSEGFAGVETEGLAGELGQRAGRVAVGEALLERQALDKHGE